MMIPGIHQKTWSFGIRLVKTGSSRTNRKEVCLKRGRREKRSEEGKKGKADRVRECVRGNADESATPTILDET